jgi:threonine synthase
MKFSSTKGTGSVSLDTALVRGIAADGGLYLPECLPVIGGDGFLDAPDINCVARVVLQPFFTNSVLESDLDDIIAETFHFPLPVRKLQSSAAELRLLELYHGPTAAFKDIGAAFLAACLGRLEGDIENPLTILVATSGDTGGAVAAAFNARPGMRVAVLFPDGRVSDRQAQQLTCWGDNVLSLAVNGSFDDCQSLVKGALADPTLARHYRFSSANSINIGRLLPQSIYYADASLRHYRQTGIKPGFIVPTGNLGNALACMIAREMGLPIGEIVLATNENRIIADFLGGAAWRPRDSIQTLASAMDVGNPSNMERLRALFGDSSEIGRRVTAESVSDEEIRNEIRMIKAEFDFVVCPHTATATAVFRRMDVKRRTAGNWIAVATAHPAKFEQIVEPITGETVPVPPGLGKILSLPRRFIKIEPQAEALREALRNRFGS